MQLAQLLAGAGAAAVVMLRCIMEALIRAIREEMIACEGGPEADPAQYKPIW